MKDIIQIPILTNFNDANNWLRIIEHKNTIHSLTTSQILLSIQEAPLNRILPELKDLLNLKVPELLKILNSRLIPYRSDFRKFKDLLQISQLQQETILPYFDRITNHIHDLIPLKAGIDKLNDHDNLADCLALLQQLRIMFLRNNMCEFTRNTSYMLTKKYENILNFCLDLQDYEPYNPPNVNEAMNETSVKTRFRSKRTTKSLNIKNPKVLKKQNMNYNQQQFTTPQVLDLDYTHLARTTQQEEHICNLKLFSTYAKKQQRKQKIQKTDSKRNNRAHIKPDPAYPFALGFTMTDDPVTNAVDDAPAKPMESTISTPTLSVTDYNTEETEYTHQSQSDYYYHPQPLRSAFPYRFFDRRPTYNEQIVYNKNYSKLSNRRRPIPKHRSQQNRPSKYITWVTQDDLDEIAPSLPPLNSPPSIDIHEEIEFLSSGEVQMESETSDPIQEITRDDPFREMTDICLSDMIDFTDNDSDTDISAVHDTFDITIDTHNVSDTHDTMPNNILIFLDDNQNSRYPTTSEITPTYIQMDIQKLYFNFLYLRFQHYYYNYIALTTYYNNAVFIYLSLFYTSLKFNYNY